MNQMWIGIHHNLTINGGMIRAVCFININNINVSLLLIQVELLSQVYWETFSSLH